MSLYVTWYTLGRSKKDPYPTHRGNFRRLERGGGRDCLKNVLNFYRMSREGEGGIANFLRGGYGSFLEQPIAAPHKSSGV